MGKHTEAQFENEFMMVKARELQLENTKKLNDVLPVINTLDEVNLSKIENDTDAIKTIVSDNLDNQIDLDDINAKIEKVDKSLSAVKGQVTKLSKKIDKVLKIIEGEKDE